MRVVNRISRWLDVPSTDPDDARRRKLLNILILGIALGTVLALAINIIADVGQLDPPEQVVVIYVGTVAALILLVGIFLINRYGSGWLASVLFLLLLTIVISFVDEPYEVANGRSLVNFVLPIMMGSVLLRPYASFFMAALSGVAISVVALNIGEIPNFYAMLAFFVVALVSWLSSRGLESALQDLRVLNLELDQRVRERTGELRSILNSTADGIVVFDNEGYATMVNPALANLVGRTSQEIVGQDIGTLMRQDVNAQDRALVMDLLQNRMMEEPSVKFKWGNKILSASVAPVLLESGVEIGTVGVFRDFTLEAKIDRMKSTFVSIASHELRTPLNAIFGYTEMLREGVYGDLSGKQYDATGRIMANIRHMLSLADNLLDRAQIESGTLKFNVRTYALADLVDNAVGAMEVLARNKGLALTGEVAEDVPDEIVGDQQRVNQMVVNLIGNALKFTKDGGVHVRAYRVDADYWAVAVSDTGIGIPEEAQGRIFEPFRQADESATREHGGAGLGLSIVKQLAEMMGGWVTLDSQVGEGSTFTIFLPVDIHQAVDLDYENT